MLGIREEPYEKVSKLRSFIIALGYVDKVKLYRNLRKLSPMGKEMKNISLTILGRGYENSGTPIFWGIVRGNMYRLELILPDEVNK